MADSMVSSFWGPVTSTTELCEENYAHSSYIAEFYNTISNAPCILSWRLLVNDAFPSLQQSDETPMVWEILLYLYVLYSPDWHYRSTMPTFLFLYGAAFAVVHFFVRFQVVFKLHYIGLCLLCIPRMYKYYIQTKDLAAKRLAKLWVLTLCLATLCWLFDRVACKKMSHCNVDGTPGSPTFLASCPMLRRENTSVPRFDSGDDPYLISRSRDTINLNGVVVLNRPAIAMADSCVACTRASVLDGGACGWAFPAAGILDYSCLQQSDETPMVWEILLYLYVLYSPDWHYRSTMPTFLFLYGAAFAVVHFFVRFQVVFKLHYIGLCLLCIPRMYKYYIQTKDLAAKRLAKLWVLTLCLATHYAGYLTVSPVRRCHIGGIDDPYLISRNRDTINLNGVVVLNRPAIAMADSCVACTRASVLDGGACGWAFPAAGILDYSW
ncbi:hypothetical protein PR202_gb11310 [Eleusine coracana subsp. coracana]|uniref:Uncharacterized protein n=1 Tax=Eleusine coracana subsp. coracana TaxID=191504 RepID=A0AAV5ELS7_ELECO|nr:hypothetical protein PR202_gb11310 [Eleusine coracana subsp. coracana]